MQILVTVKSPYFLPLLVLLAIQVLFFAACADSGGVSRHSNSFRFAEIRGQIVMNEKHYPVQRTLFAAADGRSKVVLSTITNDQPGIGKVDRSIKEYLLNDTVFSYDSGDSSLLAFTLADLEIMGIVSLPFSGSWLFIKETGFEPLSASQCEPVEGYASTTYRQGNYEICFLNGQAISLNGNEKHRIHQEYLYRIVADTSTNEEIFRQPTGFRRILPS